MYFRSFNGPSNCRRDGDKWKEAILGLEMRGMEAQSHRQSVQVTQ